ncbi:hypothetical protein F5Y10DRAFT_282497 [Nemania abortiva]|nr:hypothetical protein F5Y10DRAFT_282497 [Nemania abortiva]
MASKEAAGSIADHVAQTLAAFGAINTLGNTQEAVVQTIDDQLSRFKLWAGNIGAHRTGHSSLDYRLRDSSHLRTQVLRLLNDSTTSLNEVYSILSGETLPWDEEFGELGELDEELTDLLKNETFEFESELDQLTKEIADAISNLLRLSMSLRNPAPHDRFMSTEYAKVRYFEANDKAHVEAKFPKADQSLIIRLGQALSQRRQYFRYRESHHEKLARGLFDPGRPEADAQSTVASSIPLAMRVPGTNPVFGELDEDERSDTGFSQTSFATTAPDSERLRIPPLPKKSDKGPFECPFCFMLIFVKSTHQWKKHVLRDLRPYVCLAKDCPAAGREYGRRHEWMSHMFQKHWKRWACPYECGLDYTTEAGLRQHVGSHGSTTEMELDSVIARCGRSQSLSAVFPTECPLCRDTLDSVQQYQRHIGRHQVDLALFALPKIEEEDENESGEWSEDEETTSIESGSNFEALGGDIPPAAFIGQTEIENNIHEGDWGAERMLSSNSGSEPDQIPSKELETDVAENQDSESKRVSQLSDSELEPGHPDEEQEASQQDYELQRVKKELEELRLVSRIEQDDDSLQRIEYEDYDLREAKKELDGIHNMKDRDKLQHRIGQQIDFDNLEKEGIGTIAVDKKNENKSLEEVERIPREDSLTERDPSEDRNEEAVEGHWGPEVQRALEETEKRKRDEEYKRRMREQLLKSGINEQEIDSILTGNRTGNRYETKGKERAERGVSIEDDNTRPTYTRMSRRHLSLETLRVYNIDYDLDQDPDYVLIKRWVPEPEQDQLWRHTRALREQRGLATEDGETKSDHLEQDVEWARKKKRGKRSKSPSLLMYLAGARPS